MVKIGTHYFYNKKNKLGSGSFGTVYKGIDKNKNINIAIKVVPH